VALIQRELKRCVPFLEQMCQYIRLAWELKEERLKMRSKGARYLIVGRAITMTLDPLQAGKSFKFATQEAKAYTKAKMRNEK